MRRHRVFIDQNLEVATQVALADDAARHLGQVLRVRSGQSVIVFDGRGNEFDAEVVELRKRSARIFVQAQRKPIPESPLEIHLGQGMARGDRMDFAIQKSVELGVRSITPLSSERTVLKLEGERVDRRLKHWSTVAANACEQCGRAHLARVGEPVTLENWVETVTADLKLTLDPLANRTLTDISLDGRRVALLIGPEGGLTEHEIARASRQGFVAVSVGPRILRAETAATAAVTAVQLKWGDLG